MKLLTMQHGNQAKAGVVLDDDALDLAAAAALLGLEHPVPASLKELLALGNDGLALARRVLALAAPAKAKLRAASALVPMATVTLAPVIPDADLVFCGSMNSRGHLHEMGDPLPAKPIGFQKVRSALTASGAPILLPPDNAAMVDWEGEFCAVFGTPCHRVSAAEALDHIVGYTLLNDVSAREFVKDYVTGTTVQGITSAWELIVAGKNFPTFCPLGPVLLTKDEFDADVSYHLETVVNGEVMQSSTREDLVFTIAEMVSYFSHFYAFQPGDVISMGSPPGVGMARKPPLFLKPGDVVEVREPRIGVLRNTVKATVETTGNPR